MLSTFSVNQYTQKAKIDDNVIQNKTRIIYTKHVAFFFFFFFLPFLLSFLLSFVVAVVVVVVLFARCPVVVMLTLH